MSTGRHQVNKIEGHQSKSNVSRCFCGVTFFRLLLHGSEAKVKLYLVLKNSDDKHDAKAQEYPSILQEEEAIVTEACITSIIV